MTYFKSDHFYDRGSMPAPQTFAPLAHHRDEIMQMQ